MKVLFLGTGAADYIYETDRNTEGYRRNSSVLIDDKILIDPGPCVCDATIGFVDGDYRIFEHCNLNMIIEMKKTLNEYINRICISHMAKTLHTDHETLVKDMSEYDIEVAFDGFCTEV